MRVRLVLIALLSALAFALAGCGGDDDPEEIRFLVFGDPEEIQAYRTLISEYEKRDDSGPVQLIEASDREDLLARLSTSFAGGSPPDVFLLNYRFYGQFAARDALEPLEERIEDSDKFEPDDSTRRRSRPSAGRAFSRACRRTSPVSSSITTVTSSAASRSPSRRPACRGRSSSSARST